MNLECGVRCLIDNKAVLVNGVDWFFIGQLLEDGRIYE